MVGEVSPCLKVSQNYDANKSVLRKERHLWMCLKYVFSKGLGKCSKSIDIQCLWIYAENRN